MLLLVRSNSSFVKKKKNFGWFLVHSVFFGPRFCLSLRSGANGEALPLREGEHGKGGSARSRGESSGSAEESWKPARRSLLDSAKSRGSELVITQWVLMCAARALRAHPRLWWPQLPPTSPGPMMQLRRPGTSGPCLHGRRAQANTRCWVWLPRDVITEE